MKTKFFLLTLLLAGIASAFNPPEPARHKKFMDDLKLTDAQKEQFEKISFETQKKQIDLRAKMETAQLELRRLMDAETIDKGAIEKKFNEIASVQTSLKMNHINAWSEKNKVLNADQQKLWKKMLNKTTAMAHKKMRAMKHIERREIIRPGQMMRAPMAPEKD